MKSFFIRLNQTRELYERENTERSREVLEIVKRVDDYINRKFQKRIQHVRVATLPSKEAAQILGTSNSNVKVARKVMSDKLYEVFGEDFFERLANPTGIKEVRRIVNSLDVNCDRLLPVEMIGYIDNLNYDVDDDIDIKDCKEEIDYLYNNSINSMHTNILMLNGAKLKYLLSVLRGEKGSAKDRAGLATILMD